LILQGRKVIMKYGIVISVSKTKFGPIVFKEDLEDNIKKAKRFGYDAVELAVREIKKIDTKKINLLLEKNCLVIPTIGTGQIYVEEGLSFADPDKIVRDKSVGRVKEVICLAKNFNAAVIIGLVRGCVDKTSENYGKNIKITEDRILECLVKCLEYSENYSTNFLLEPLNRYETNIFNSIEETSNFLEKNNSKLDLKRIGILADTFHMNIEEPVIHESFDKFKNLIKHVHFADSNRKPPGYGHIDFSNVIKVLKKNKYNGFISFEMLPFPDPDSAAKKGIDFIKGIYNK